MEIADEVLGAAEAKESTTPMSSARASLRNVDLNLDPTDEEDEITVRPQAQSSAPATSSIAATTEPSVPLSGCLGTAWHEQYGDGPCPVCFVKKP